MKSIRHFCAFPQKHIFLRRFCPLQCFPHSFVFIVAIRAKSPRPTSFLPIYLRCEPIAPKESNSDELLRVLLGDDETETPNGRAFQGEVESCRESLEVKRGMARVGRSPTSSMSNSSCSSSILPTLVLLRARSRLYRWVLGTATAVFRDEDAVADGERGVGWAAAARAASSLVRWSSCVSMLMLA